MEKNKKKVVKKVVKKVMKKEPIKRNKVASNGFISANTGKITKKIPVAKKIVKEVPSPTEQNSEE